MEELLQEFRKWDSSWWKYDQFGGTKPISADEFIKELSKKYKIIKNE